MIEEFKKILKAEGITGKEMAELLDITHGSYRSLTRKSATSVPKWVRAGILFYTMGKMAEQVKNMEVVDAKKA